MIPPPDSNLPDPGSLDGKGRLRGTMQWQCEGQEKHFWRWDGYAYIYIYIDIYVVLGILIT